MFGNEGDRPYLLKATPESLAAMATAVGILKRDLKVPFGVNYLWDPVATVALGVATGARFGREILTGVYASDMGLWAPDCAAALRLRHDLGRDDFKLLSTSMPSSRRRSTRGRSRSGPPARCSPRSPT